MPQAKLILEVCLESVADVIAARDGGADRVELCSDLVEGGLTPSAGAVRLAVERGGLPVMAMVRPRGGDFLYSDLEYQVMRADARVVAQSGAAGAVFGLLSADGTIDRERTARLVELVRPLEVTFHRAFDMTRDPQQSLETLIELGVDRVLTSGQERAVPDGLELLRQLVAQAGDRIIVMPGAGIEVDNIASVAAATGARELHFAALGRRESGMQFRNPRPDMAAGPAPGEYEIQQTDVALVRRLVEAARAV